jgi:hypothetical protein
MSDLLTWRERLFNNALGVFSGNDKPDAGAWQKKIDSRYELEIEIGSVVVSLYDSGELVLRFVWEGIVEIQSLQREEFPSIMWKVISRSGEYLIPSGGRYAEHLEKDLIYTLPDYRLQQPVKIDPPTGYKRAVSLWRENDSFPKRRAEDFEDLAAWGL